MKTINTYSGEIMSPLVPKTDQIHLIDIAHSLSQMCRANGHFDRFFSIAQHCINCAIEARERGYSKKVQLACLFHDSSEAYISDITRPVKECLPNYIEMEERLQNLIYEKFLEEKPTEEELKIINEIDFNMLILEFNTLTTKRIFEKEPKIYSKPNLKFTSFNKTKRDFLKLYKEIM